MSVERAWNSVINAGVIAGQRATFTDKLIARNKLAFFCSLFSLFYVALFFIKAMWLPLAAISAGIFIFVISIFLNHFKKFTLSSILILVNTNYCVLFFSLYLGFNSGIHLYLFTSPLIVLTAFDTSKIRVLSTALSSYIINFFIISILGIHYDYKVLMLNAAEADVLYFVNFSCSCFLLISLSLYFLFNNNKINQLLTQKNNELLLQQQKLLTENKIRKEAENTAKESLSQKDILLSEIHHRVKNNLAVVNGLMELQSVYIEDKATVNIFKECQNRIKSIALLHEKLYENKTYSEVNVGPYIDELIRFINTSHSIRDKNVNIQTKIDEVSLCMTKAMPFALLINELITNSYKHAFKKQNSGQICIDLGKNENTFLFKYSDDGSGFEYTNQHRNSLGLNLIETFSRQLDGDFQFQKSDSRMEFMLQFK